MYTRTVEVIARDGKRDQLLETIKDSVMKKLRTQPGFTDLVALVSDQDRNRLLAISFWDTKENAERYSKDHFNEISQMINPYLEKGPVVQTFQVEASTMHRIAIGKAA